MLKENTTRVYLSLPSTFTLLNRALLSVSCVPTLRPSSAFPSPYSYSRLNCPKTYFNLTATCQGIASVYNKALALTSDDPSASRLKDELASDLVLDSFFLHAIMRDKAHRRNVLKLPHHGMQDQRLNKVLAERNYIMVGTGQEMWAHTCARYTKVKMESGVCLPFQDFAAQSSFRSHVCRGSRWHCGPPCCV